MDVQLFIEDIFLPDGSVVLPGTAAVSTTTAAAGGTEDTDM